jgi:hypothetical protein
MDKPILTDKDQHPTDALVFSHLGKARTHWQALFAHLQAEHPDFVGEWRYYKDGGSWLCKVARKTKTIFWLSVVPGAFVTAFYFGDKAEPAVLASAIPEPLKESFRNGKRYGKIRAITVRVESAADLADVQALIALKLSTK